ncbi:hypothetical protein DFH05DRAFT_1585348 [Lentinula detonsa]|uniref:Uncharacterized protein n=1 Tax=Lentinula detonsa TaxID=2804962 RepID=A0A9W8NS84_9AGAR|nr:hypothetical protein DFH05DRAFT_1585348 [Lentinula detonsa]
MAGGYNPPNNGHPQASPERNPRHDDSPPLPEQWHSRPGNRDRNELHDRGRGPKGPEDGGPPSEPPSPEGDGDNSPPKSEDDRRSEGRRKKKAKKQNRESTPNWYQSEDPTATIVETYDYDPRPRSEEEVLRASFYRYEQQIMFYLHGPPLNQNSAAQKAILQNIPKPSKWNGEADYTKFDEWILAMIQWMNIADQCGPPTRFSQTRGAHILTSVDLIRTNTLGSYLEGNALRWFRDEVQKVPDGFSTSHNPDPLSYRWTFMQVVNGLYQRFIHEASISQVANKFNEVTYNCKDGAKEGQQHTKNDGTSSGKPAGKRGSCFDCGEYDHYRGSPLCKQQRPGAKSDQQQRPKLYRIAEEVQEGGECMFRSKETSEEEVAKSDSDDLSDEDIWVRYESESNSEKDQMDHTWHIPEGEPDPWGGSQFDSDTADDDYIPALSLPEESIDGQPRERMGHMRNWDTFTVHWREQLDERFNALNIEDTANQDAAATSYDKMQDTLPVPQLGNEPETVEAYRLDFTEYLRSMTRTEDGGFQATTDPKKTKIGHTGTRPVRKAKDNQCLCAFMEINGVMAFVLLDSGSTADAVSPDFARVSHIKPFQLENPVTLQLGTKGSHSRITFGCTSRYRILGGKHGDVTGKDYFDIANVDRYDAVLGTVFMQKHGIALDFERNVIRLSGKEIPTLTEGDENRKLARRYAKNVSSNIHLQEGEELPETAGNAQSERVEPPWSRFTPTVEEEADEDISNERVSLNRNLPVLLDPNDQITIDDIEAMVNEATEGSFKDHNTNPQLHEIEELLEEMSKEQSDENTSSKGHTNIPHKNSPDIMETMKAVSERFNQ